MTQYLLDAAGIAGRIPHSGTMCLLAGVVSWSPARIHCRATSHRAMDNPLRSAGRLGPANGIEYAAQAMAVHGALLAGREDAPQAGFLTSVREVVFHAVSLDVAADLDILAEQQSGEGAVKLYGFRIEADGVVLIEGRATVMPDAGNR
jgi:predicted hotdog family 3-hydroxylacyl-ACP dehydratase